MTQLTGSAEGGRDAGRGGDGGKATAGGWGHVPGPQRTIGLQRVARRWRWRVCLFKYELCLGYPLARPPPTAPRSTPTPTPPRRTTERAPPIARRDRHRSPPRNSSVLYTKNKQTNITCTHIVYTRGAHTRTHTISQTPTLCRNKHTNTQTKAYICNVCMCMLIVYMYM